MTFYSYLQYRLQLPHGSHAPAHLSQQELEGAHVVAQA